jgi:hypothetical protein
MFCTGILIIELADICFLHLLQMYTIKCAYCSFLTRKFQEPFMFIWYIYDFNYHRISVGGLEEEVRQVATAIKTLDSRLNEDEHGIRSYFEGKFTFQ